MLSQTNKKIAIIGATGNVGRKLIELFRARNKINPNTLILFASSKSKGLQLNFNENSYVVQDVAHYNFKDCYLAIFATESDVSKHYIPKALDAGAKVIDASSAYRLDPNVPLIVPPVNGNLVTNKHQLFAHANCLASPIAVVLKPLHDYATATRVNASTYQSTSGAGKGPMDELYQQTKSVYDGISYENKHFPRQIAFNTIPQVGKILEDGFSYEEFKIIKEVQKIISDSIAIVATSVRVPVMIGHGISLTIEFANKIELQTVKEILSSSPGIKLSQNEYTTPVEVVGNDDVFVGRIRRDPTVFNGILLWLVSDNLHRGAALDAVEISEKILALQ